MASILAIGRSELRGRWPALVAVALLVGLVGAVALTAFAGARRTSSSYDRFRGATLGRDVSVQVDDPEIVEPVAAAVEELPEVTASTRIMMYPVYPDESQVNSAELDLAIVSSTDGALFSEIERPHLLAGRLPHPDSADEIVLNELASLQSGLDVGDTVDVATFTPEDLDVALSGEAFQGFNGPVLTLEVVGLVRLAEELQGSDSQVGPTAMAGPGLYTAHGDEMGGLGPMLVARLRGGEADVGDVEQVVREVAGPEGEVFVESANLQFGNNARDAISVIATALVVFGLTAAVAGALAVGGAMSRQVAATASLGQTLGALGLTRWSRAAASATPVCLAVVAGAAVALLIAVPSSSLTPIGLARRAEPDPGISADLTVLLLGSVTIVALGIGWALVTGWRLTGGASRADSIVKPSAVVTTAARGGIGPVGVTGLRHAFERGRGRTAVPARSALFAVALGIGGLIAAATVSASVDDLLSSPTRFGWGWSAEPDATEGIERAARSLVDDPDVAGTAVGHNRAVELEGRSVQGMAVEVVGGEIGMVVRDGREPRRSTEVALGARTAEELGVGIGDTVTARSSDGQGEVELLVTGTAVFRPVDNPHPGEGALLTPGGLQDISRSEGFRSVLVRYADDVDPTRVEARLQAEHPVEFSAYARPRAPGNILNLDRATGVIEALGAFFVALGIAGLAHALATSVRRRRTDLAVLRAMGMARRQVRLVVSWQALALLAVGSALGVPAGLAAGRTVWQLMVGDLGLIDHPTNPWAVVTIAVPLALVLALLLSWGPGRAATRIRPATALRAE